MESKIEVLSQRVDVSDSVITTMDLIEVWLNNTLNCIKATANSSVNGGVISYASVASLKPCRLRNDHQINDTTLPNGDSQTKRSDNLREKILETPPADAEDYHNMNNSKQFKTFLATNKYIQKFDCLIR